MKLGIALVAFCWSFSSLAQSGSNNARIINALAGVSIEQGQFEFEPNVSVQTEREFWNQNGNLVSFGNDTAITSAALGFRLNYSPISRLEIGAFVPSQVYEIQTAAKYALIADSSSLLGLGVFYNTTFTFADRPINTAQRDVDDQYSHSLGIGLNYDFSERLILDASVEYQLSGLSQENPLSDFFAFVDIGYYIWPNFLVFNSIGYQRNHPEVVESFVLTTYPGITIESGENFVIQLAGQFDLDGKNTTRLSGGNLALTLLFD